MSENTAVTKQADTGSTEAALIPPVNVYEDAAGITLYADLPGVPKDKLVVQVEGDILTIKGEVVLAQPDDMEASYTEVSLPRYRRVFSAIQGTGCREGRRRTQPRRAQAAHPESRTRATEPHRGQGGVM
jgi:hypothetical protein